MNKIKTAAIIAAAFVSAGAGAAEVYKTDSASLSVYGRVKAEALNGYGYQKISAKTDKEDHPGFSLTSRLGVSGESKVNDFFSVFGNVIYDLNSEDGIDADDRLKIRFGYVGVRFGEYGELTAGHQLNAAYNALRTASSSSRRTTSMASAMLSPTASAITATTPRTESQPPSAMRPR